MASRRQIMTKNSYETMWFIMVVDYLEIVSCICLEALSESRKVQPRNLALGYKSNPLILEYKT